MRRRALILIVMLGARLAGAANITEATVDTTLADGLVVSGSVNLVYSPIDDGRVSLEVNGREILGNVPKLGMETAYLWVG